MIRNSRLVQAVGACGLSLTLALAGCGSTSSSESASASSSAASTSEKTAVETESTTVIVVPKEMEDASNVTKGIIETGDVSAAKGFDELVEESDGGMVPGTTSSEIETGTGEEDKASTTARTLVAGGIQITIPAEWFTAMHDEGFTIKDPDGNVTCLLEAVDKPSNGVDIESYVKSIPMSMLQEGYDNVHVLGYNTYYTKSGKICAADLTFSAEKDKTEYLYFIELVESKSYLNGLQFFGTTEGFGKVVDQVSDILDSLKFAPGEAL